MRMVAALLAATVAVVPTVAAAEDFQNVGQPIGPWQVVRTVDAMTDARRCMAIYNGHYDVQLTAESLAINYRGRGGVSSYRYRLDDAPAAELELATRIEREISAIVIRGNRYQAMLGAHRVRVQALTVLDSSVLDDIDMSRSAEVITVLTGPECTGTAPTGQQGTAK